ncbi:MAG: KTSC domain-containing protein [Lentisphaerae bacterium]|jgi:phosphatidylserine/phosphatidylglycerophosphate/cardiolipin synthase-like enzyme|nr:KTSC domain-containing protein [Lentisphaerota bacterium]
MKRTIWLIIALAGVTAFADVERLDVDHDWLRDITYEREADEATGTLSLRLGNDPALVRYFEMPVEAWEEFKASESKGSFYATHIRQRYERQYGKSRQEVFDSPLPIETSINALLAFNEECEPVILRAIEKSRESIYVAAYAFTRTRIAAALAKAHKRGVRVEVKMDANQAEFVNAQRLIQYLRDQGIPVTLIHTAGTYSAMHNKFMIFDMRWLVTGSYNFTTTAQVSNWENLVWMDSADMAELCKQAWDAIVSDEVHEPTTD